LATGPRQFVVQEALETEDDRDVLVLGGGGDDDLLGPGREVGLGLLRLREEAGGLDDVFDLQRLPGELGRVLHGQDLDRAPGDADGVSLRLHLVGQVPEDGVVLQQMRESGRVRDVVDGHELELLLVQRGPKDVAPDAAEAVDPYADSHCRRLQERLDGSEEGQSIAGAGVSVNPGPFCRIIPALPGGAD
jgi:hypothetical protein